MKKLIFLIILAVSSVNILAQATKAGNQNAATTATLNASSRLFKAKEDLTSVIVVLPAGSTVTVLGSDSTYYHVTYEEYEGYIQKKHAVIDTTPVIVTKAAPSQQQAQSAPSGQNEQQMSRYTYLENKYGTTMANRLNSGKIWKGMNSELVKDSWGKPQKINRVVSDNTIKEEWLYKTTWLYFENNTLIDWGPTKQ